MALFGAISAAHAYHTAVVGTYCRDGGSRQIQKVELFDTETGERLRWWDAESLTDEDTGLEAWMKRDKPENWETHKSKIYKQLVKGCGKS